VSGAAPEMLAAVDVGSNSIKLLIGALGADGRVVVRHEEVVVTRLSEGVDACRTLSPAAVDRSLAVLRRFGEACRTHGVARTATVGTAVLRDALDADDFCAGARLFGFDIEIISGDVEAQVVRLAALRELPGTPADAVVIDIGGGSSELSWATGRESTELGVVRLTERHVRRDPAGPEVLAELRRVVQARLARLPLPTGVEILIGSSATCAVLARLDLVLPAHDRDRIHGHEISTAALTARAEQLAGLDLAARQALPGMDRTRADVILAGTVVLEQTALAIGARALRINDCGTRYGVFHRAFG
jgi:exopolyphosphatase/guanosine-5'-triphosphate,3'-diphosphate pyrophosphatase